ncbi:ABC transporter ATP-binding protein, partial [Bacteroides uniformis]
QQFFGMSVGTAVAVIAYVSKVFEPLESIGMEIQNIQSAVAGVFRINEFLNEPGRSIQNHENVILDENSPAAA